MPLNNLIIFNLTMWGIKVFIEICGLPVSLFLAHKLKQYEKLDIFDNDTKFSLFNFNAKYQKENNHYNV